MAMLSNLQVVCKRKTPHQNKEDSFDKNQEETQVVDNVQDTSAQRGKGTDFDPSYDYMG